MPEQGGIEHAGKGIFERVSSRLIGAAGRPSSAWAAMGRGALGRCPSCGRGKLFRKFLKPIANCSRCNQDWTHQQADDFPAYVAVFLTGHIMAPIIIALMDDMRLSPGALLAIIVPLAIALMMVLLQPAKGLIIALQWWFGMHGFRPGKDQE